MSATPAVEQEEGPSPQEDMTVHDDRRLYKSKTAMLHAKAQEGRHDAYRTIGVITIEDVIEELLQVGGGGVMVGGTTRTPV